MLGVKKSNFWPILDVFRLQLLKSHRFWVVSSGKTPKIGQKPDFLTPNICIYSESSDFELFSGFVRFLKIPFFRKNFQFLLR